MNRRLVLMRHAQAGPPPPGGTDHSRPLTARGRSQAAHIARALVSLGWAPAVVHLSDACRTRQTWDVMSSDLPRTASTAHAGLYLAGLPDIAHIAQGWPEDLSGPVLVLGHNPGWQLAATLLCREPTPMGTAAAILLDGHGATWTEALAGVWRKEAHLTAD